MASADALLCLVCASSGHRLGCSWVASFKFPDKSLFDHMLTSRTLNHRAWLFPRFHTQGTLQGATRRRNYRLSHSVAASGFARALWLPLQIRVKAGSVSVLSTFIAGGRLSCKRHKGKAGRFKSRRRNSPLPNVLVAL